MAKTSSDKFSRFGSDPQGIPDKALLVMARRLVRTHEQREMWRRKIYGPRRLIRCVKFVPVVHVINEEINMDDL